MPEPIGGGGGKGHTRSTNKCTRHGVRWAAQCHVTCSRGDDRWHTGGGRSDQGKGTRPKPCGQDAKRIKGNIVSSPEGISIRGVRHVDNEGIVQRTSFCGKDRGAIVRGKSIGTKSVHCLSWERDEGRRLGGSAEIAAETSTSVGERGWSGRDQFCHLLTTVSMGISRRGAGRVRAAHDKEGRCASNNFRRRCCCRSDEGDAAVGWNGNNGHSP
mmetsp:Transcript_26471/g.60969  ORF Transcript_26471/g.60969 Transcript_26471/m.60969 type:complete len:214 (-) Transcript_26471:248-889(-)